MKSDTPYFSQAEDEETPIMVLFPFDVESWGTTASGIESWGPITAGRQVVTCRTATPDPDFVGYLAQECRARIVSKHAREILDAIIFPTIDTSDEEISLDYQDFDSAARSHPPENIDWGTGPGYTFSSLFDDPGTD